MKIHILRERFLNPDAPTYDWEIRTNKGVCRAMSRGYFGTEKEAVASARRLIKAMKAEDLEIIMVKK